MDGYSIATGSTAYPNKEVSVPLEIVVAHTFIRGHPAHAMLLARSRECDLRAQSTKLHENRYGR